jgi:hypothetical protein
VLGAWDQADEPVPVGVIAGDHEVTGGRRTTGKAVCGPPASTPAPPTRPSSSPWPRCAPT